MKVAAICCCIVYLVVAGGATAGYTDDLWDESEDRIYYDCGDWSGIHNAKNTDLGSHWYWYRKHHNNGRYMSDPTNWGYPTGTYLKQVGSEDVAWATLWIKGFDHELHFNDTIYTDNPANINYKTSYLQYSGWWTQYFRTYKAENTITSYSRWGAYRVANHITFFSSYTDDDGNEEKREKKVTVRDALKYSEWPVPNHNVVGELVDHGYHMLLKLPMPSDATGVRIVATSRNTTAVYERHDYCLALNQTDGGFNIHDLIEYKYHSFEGLSPYGSDVYLLHPEPDYNITMTLYTPFEQIKANLTLHEYVVIREKPRIVLKPLFQLMYFLVPILLTIMLYRRL